MLSSGRKLANCTHRNRNARPKTLAPVLRPMCPGGLVTIGRQIPPLCPMSIFFFSVFMLVVPVSRQANRSTLNTLWGVRHKLVSIRPTGVTYCSDTTEEFSGAFGLSGCSARTSIWSRSPQS